MVVDGGGVGYWDEFDVIRGRRRSSHCLLLKRGANERREETRDDKHGLRTEFRYGAFTRTVPLRAGATVEDVKASYADGVLEVRVPVGEAAAKKVQITRS